MKSGSISNTLVSRMISKRHKRAGVTVKKKLNAEVKKSIEEWSNG